MFHLPCPVSRVPVTAAATAARLYPQLCHLCFPLDFWFVIFVSVGSCMRLVVKRPRYSAVRRRCVYAHYKKKKNPKRLNVPVRNWQIGRNEALFCSLECHFSLSLLIFICVSAFGHFCKRHHIIRSFSFNGMPFVWTTSVRPIATDIIPTDPVPFFVARESPTVKIIISNGNSNGQWI